MSCLRTLTLWLLAAGAFAQVPAAVSAPAHNADPLGRSTPRGTVKGFLRATHESSYSLAAQFLESGRDPESVKQLQAVLDAGLRINLNDISDDPPGRFDDGLPAERERIGTVRIAGESVDIVLHRVSAGTSGQVWLFSSDTLRRIPALHDNLAPDWIEAFLPGPVKNREFYGVEIWRLAALLLLIPLALGIAWLIGMILLRIVKTVARRTWEGLDQNLSALLRGPLRLFLAALLFHAGALMLGLPLLVRMWLGQFELVVGIFAVSWFALRLIDLAAAETRQVLIRTKRTAAISMVPLGRRIVKVAAIALAGLAVLDNAGFDLKAILTGLGVGGIAVALAAQKTLENIFGGVAIVADQPIRVGDFCKFGDNTGTVEDIGLRSTRIRTLDRTVIAVPNAAFSTVNIENFAPRDKIWFHPTVALRLDTTPDQVRDVLAGLRQMLSAHPKVEPGGRARLVGLGSTSLNVEIFSYVATADFDEFVVIQEDLLLRILEIVDAAGTGLALPAGTNFPGLNPRPNAPA